MFRFVVLLSVAAVISGQSTPVNQCTHNSGPLPIHAYIEGCDSLPCDLPQLQDAVIHMIFRAPETIHRMRTFATAILPPLPAFNYPLFSNGETCNFLTNTYCPVVKGEVIQYTLRMYIQPSFQVGVQPEIEFMINDHDRNKEITCIRVPLRIVEAVNSRTGANNATVIGAA
ncbi:unnamed protein product [Chrysodeixis includens]|uniref:MD-2-related lipid-recognition domain-containing protein n=1 Tax=Chrysodeixis includens TaxID=689277 RepID=A0A9P0FVX5_CHRIL|nr:unnamed protein product [Chrysodeixis includens]